METLEDLGAFTFKKLWKNTLKKYSNRPAFALVGEEPISYEQAGVKVENFRKELIDYGLTKGDRVAILSSSCPNWGISFLSIVLSGGIAVPLLPDFSEKEIETFCKHSEVEAIIVSEKLYGKLSESIKEKIPFIIKIEDFSFYKNSLKKIEKPVYEIPIEDTETASIIYTSGTTGKSKGVELTHKNLVFMCIQCQNVHRVNKYDVVLSFLPLSHVYEFTIGFSMQILNGSCIYYLGKPPTVSSLLPAFKAIKPTIVLSVPLIMEKIFKNKVLPEINSKKILAKLYKIPFFRKIFHKKAVKLLKKTFGGRVNFFGIGGAKLDKTVERFLKEGKFPYAIGYGLTETSPLIAGSNPKNTKIGTIGPVVPKVEVKIDNPDPNTNLGEILVRGDNIMKGYYKEEELTKNSFTDDGWFKTGDLGFIDKKGYLSIKGRSKNMILGASGENIYPEDIEFVINQHPLVNESLVVEGDNGLVAIVQIDEEKAKKENKGLIPAIGSTIGNVISNAHQSFVYSKESLLNEIKFFVNSQVNKSSKVSKIETVPFFEKTATQKIKRYFYKFTQQKKPDEEKPSKKKKN